MNLLMFPRMLTSHDQGWVWLMRVHPSVFTMYLFYAAPLSLLPPAMLLYAARAGDTMLGNLSMNEAWRLATLFYIAELIMVPLMAAIIQQIGNAVRKRPDFHDAFAFAAVAPTPLWLSALALFVPSQAFNALATLVALFAAGVLIYEGTRRVFALEDDTSAPLLTGSILAAGLVAWAALMGLALVGASWVPG